MNYTEMLFNRDERLVNLLNQADSKNIELIEEINNREDEIERLNNNIDKAIEYMNEVLECNYHGGNVTFDALVHNTEHILRGSDKE